MATTTRVTRAPGSRQLAAIPCILTAVILLGAVLHVTIVSQFLHNRSQQLGYADLRGELSRGEAPTGQVDLEGRPIVLGTPVYIIDIPRLGQTETVFEGTSPAVMEKGPGHLRSTVLPGQVGTSVVFGRQNAYGGPFRGLASLRPGDAIGVTTGQGRFVYTVAGLRRDGSVSPPPPAPDGGRLTLVTTEGPPFLAARPMFVDATLSSPPAQTPVRVIGAGSLLPSERLGARDYTQLPALMLWMLGMAALALALTWAAYRWGRAQAWIVGFPCITVVIVGLGTTVSRLLPNLT